MSSCTWNEEGVDNSNGLPWFNQQESQQSLNSPSSSLSVLTTLTKCFTSFSYLLTDKHHNAFESKMKETKI